jgi:hypothetical protein
MKNACKLKASKRIKWITITVTKSLRIEELSKWCKEHDSEGRFYHYHASDKWHFEKEKDASYFALRWV